MKKTFSLILAFALAVTSLVFASADEEIVIERSSSWKISASTEMNSAFSVEKAFDGNDATLWHSLYTVVDGGAVPSEIPSSITVDFGKEETVSGFTYVRRKDNPSGLFTSFEVFASSDGSNFTSIYTGTFDFGSDRSDMSDKTASWGNKKMRAIRILFTGRGVATAAEIKFLREGKADGNAVTETVTENPAQSGGETKILEKTGAWTISASTEMNANLSAEKAFDGNDATLWHSLYTVVDGGAVPSEIPSSITVDFGKEETVSGFTYVRRKDNPSGLFTSFEVFASSDGSNFTSIYKGTFDFGSDRSDMSDKTASWGNKKMRAIRILFTGRGVATAAEIKFLREGKADSNAVTETVTEKPAPSSGETKILEKTDAWTISASTEMNANLSAEKAFDGNDATLWHSLYTVVDGGAVPSEIPSSITVDFGKEEMVSGFTYVRRKDNPSGLFTSFEVFASSDGANFTSIYSGTFDFGSDRSDMSDKTASWGNKKMRAIRILFTGRGVATAAEIKFITNSVAIEQVLPEVKKASNGASLLERSTWTITADSEIKSVPITNVLDGDKNTFWHSFYTATGGSVTSKDEPPFTIEIDLKKKEKISGIIFTPRDSKAGIITKFDLYASADGGEYKKLLEDKVLLADTDEKEVLFKNNVEADKLKIVVTEGTSKYGTLAEFNVAGENKNAPTISFEEFFSEDSLERMVAIDKTDITVNCEAPFWASFKPGNIIDGNTNTFWQTEAGSDFVLSIDFNRVEKFGEIEYIPRNTADFHGFWLDFDIAVSVDGENWETVAEHYTLEKNLGVNKISLDKEVEARYVEILFNETVERRVSCAELTFYQTVAAKNQMAERNKESYTLTIGSNVIEVYKNGESYNKELDVAPYIVNGSTLIPLRGLMEEMGATVDWVGHNQMIYIDNGVYYIEMQIWNKIVYVESQSFGRVRYALLNFPVIKDSRTFIPVRFVSEQLGYDVTWVAEEQKIIITKAA